MENSKTMTQELSIVEKYAKAYCKFNGQAGTAKQIAKIVKQFSGMSNTLIAMCQQRGITIS